MKRKIFSKLLMGAFLIASVSSFVSCKDYDDDINNLQKQIDAAALKAELTTLQTNLAAQIAAAQSAAQAAQAAAEKAQATANNAATKDALEAVKTLATAAGTDAAKAIADAANAQNTADVAKSAATAAQEAAAAAQNVANGASDKAATALADAAKALATAEAASATANKASETASAADATAKEAKATADNAIAAAGNATTQAADAVKAAGEAKAAAEAARYNDEAVKLLIAQAQASADAAAQDAKDAAEAAAAAVLASASATEDAATAKEAAAKAEETIKDAIANATKAIEEATDAKIKAAVAEAVAKIPTDQSEAVAEQAAAIETLKGNLQTLADAQGKLATAEGLSAAVEELGGKIDGVVDAAGAAAAAAATGALKEAYATLYSTITSVELVASYSAWDFDEDVVTFPYGVSAGSISTPAVDLDFFFGTQIDSKFGDAETESLDQDADDIKVYKKGADINTNMALLVRVNPVNAEFTKDQVKFVNSKLENLDKIVEILEPKRFEGMITRGQESGLWIVPVKVKEGVKFNEFNEETFYKETAWDKSKDYVKNDNLAPYLLKGDLDLSTYTTQKLYAIAINNSTDPDAADRYVTSTYDITASYQHFVPAYDLQALFNYIENNKIMKPELNDIHNRWTPDVENDEVLADGSKAYGIRSWDYPEEYTLLNPEMKWNYYSRTSKGYTEAGLVTPNAYEPNKPTEGKLKDGTKVYDASIDRGDFRYTKPMLHVEKIGNTVKVSLPTPATSSYYTNYQQKVEWWYISYDFEKNAVESAPSEWRAWNSYRDEIDGLYKMHRGTQTINLTINHQPADGDVIGFRVWAVNYDGSLLDPDGRAFYVKVGEEPKGNPATANVNIMAIDAAAALPTNLLDANTTAEKGFNVSVVTNLSNTDQFQSLKLGNNPAGKAVAFGGTTTFKQADNKDVLDADVNIQWQIVDAKGKAATNWKDAKAVKAAIAGADLKHFKDGASLTLDMIEQLRTDAYNKELYQIQITFTKQMPDNDWTNKNRYQGLITWKSDYDPTTNVLTAYTKPYKSDVLYPYFVAATTTTPEYFRWKYRTAAEVLNDWTDDVAFLNWDWSVNPDFANAGVREINDYIASVDPKCVKSRYQFKFKGLPTDTKKGDADYVTDWAGTATDEKGNWAVVGVRAKAVREDKKFDSELNYTYPNISLTWNNTTKAWNPNHDLVRTAWTFKTDFKDAMDLLTYDTRSNYLYYDVWAKNSIDVPTITGTQAVPDYSLYLDWLGTNGGTNLATYAANTDFKANLFHLGQVDMRAVTVGNAVSQSFNPNTFDKFATLGTGTDNLISFLRASITDHDKVLAENKSMVTNIYNGAGIDRDVAAGGNGFVFNENYYKFDDPNRKATDPVVNAMKIKLSGDITTYLKVSASTTSPTALVLQKIGGIADPKVNINGNIELSGFDVYGKKHTFNIPVVILFNK